jgi:hypothetical protein
MIGTVYKITDKDAKVYYGSTRYTLHKRLKEHLSVGNKSASNIMDKDSMTIEALEEYYFDTDTYNKKFMLQRERYYIENLECINRSIPTQTLKEYYSKQKHRDERKITATKYYENNKELHNKRNQEYKKRNKAMIYEPLGCRICKCMTTRVGFLRHTRSKKHQSNSSGSKC